MYSTRSNDNEQAERNPIGESRNDQIWVYGAISVIYFVMISFLIVVLLLAPKYRLLTRTHEDSVVPVASEKQEDFQIPDHEQYDEVTEQPFIPSAMDPLNYDIDPRSSIFRGDYQDANSKDFRQRETNMRINSKFLHV